MVYVNKSGKVLIRVALAILVSVLFLVSATGIAVANDGNLTGVIDSLTFDGTQGWEPSMIPVSGDIYAIAYEGVDNDGFLKTVEIDSDGQITDNITDTFEFDTSQGKKPDIIHISGDVYAIAYEGTDSATDGYSDGFLKTVEIAANGTITQSALDTLEYDTVAGEYPDIIHISGDIYAIVYRGSGTQGNLKTVDIATDGTITNTVVDTFNFDTNTPVNDPCITHISGDIYAIAYGGFAGFGWLKTVEIFTDGTMTKTVKATSFFDSTSGSKPEIIPVFGDYYAIAYEGSGDDGYLKTVQINAAGTTISAVDSFVFDATKGKDPGIIDVSDNVTHSLFAVAYRGADDDGYVFTVDIENANGNIASSIIESLEYDIGKGDEPDILNISTNVYAIAYDPSGVGNLVTLGVGTVAPMVSTDAATLVEETTATLNGTLDNDGGEACQYRFGYSTSTGGPYTYTAWTGSITSGQTFLVNLTGLSKGTKYYFIAEAKNSAGTGSGAEDDFLTKPDPPPSFTATAVSSSQIDLSWTKGDGADRTYIVRKTGGYPANLGDGTLVYSSTGTSFSDTGRAPSTQYYYSAWSEVTITGSQQYSDDPPAQDNATTLAAIGVPTVSTDNVTLVEETTATLNGTLDNDGGAACQYQFGYSTSPGGPYTYTGWTGSVTTGQSFSVNLTGLSKGTKYYFIAQAKNGTGTGSGAEVDFLTKPDPPNTFTATAASGSQIDLSWVKGDGANRTYIVRKTGGYPANRADGTNVYFDTGTSFSDTGLAPSTLYYYSAWSEVTGSQQWSDDPPAQDSATTTAGAAGPGVGGEVYPVNKLAVLAPWLVLVLILFSAAFGSASRLKRRRVRIDDR